MKPNSITILCLIKMLDKTYYIHKCAGTIVCFMSRQLVQLFVSCLVSCVNHTHYSMLNTKQKDYTFCFCTS